MYYEINESEHFTQTRASVAFRELHSEKKHTKIMRILRAKIYTRFRNFIAFLPARK